jgi:hypothetical protein
MWITGENAGVTGRGHKVQADHVDRPRAIVHLHFEQRQRGDLTKGRVVFTGVCYFLRARAYDFSDGLVLVRQHNIHWRTE